MRAIGLRGFLLFFIGGCVIGALTMTALPHDRFLRYQALEDPTAPTAHWIYQRIHFDPTPIDIAFIGTSRTGLSVHTGRLEADLQSLGIAAHAVNLHIVRNGVNMQYVVAKELLSNRKVKLLVVEMIEWEDRKPHPDFVYLADTRDIVAAPLFINLDFFSDLARLPGRQLDLFLKTQQQEHGMAALEYPLPPYEGPNLDHAQFIRTRDGVRHDRNETHTEAEMAAMRIEQDREITPPLLPAALSGLEFRISRYYREQILELARAHGTPVVFLYTPSFAGPAVPPPYQRYADRADLINPWAEVQDYRLWMDVQHVNWEGAQRVTDAVAQALARRPELH